MRRIALSLIIGVVTSGCSFVFVSGPPDNHRQLPSFECTTGRAGPILDTIWTVLQSLNALTAAAVDDQRWSDTFSGNPPFSRATAIPVYLSLAALGGAGMYYGFSRTGRCREARNEQMMRGGGFGQQPGTWPPPAPAPGTSPPPPTAPAPPPPPPPGPAADPTSLPPPP